MATVKTNHVDRYVDRATSLANDYRRGMITESDYRFYILTILCEYNVEREEAN
jgi:hypothetical protein